MSQCLWASIRQRERDEAVSIATQHHSCLCVCVILCVRERTLVCVTFILFSFVCHFLFTSWSLPVSLSLSVTQAISLSLSLSSVSLFLLWFPPSLSPTLFPSFSQTLSFSLGVNRCRGSYLFLHGLVFIWIIYSACTPQKHWLTGHLWMPSHTRSHSHTFTQASPRAYIYMHEHVQLKHTAREKRRGTTRTNKQHI